MPTRIRSVASAAAASDRSAEGSTPAWSPTWKTSKPASSAFGASRAVSDGSLVVAWYPKRKGRTGRP